MHTGTHTVPISWTKALTSKVMSSAIWPLAGDSCVTIYMFIKYFENLNITIAMHMRYGQLLNSLTNLVDVFFIMMTKQLKHYLYTLKVTITTEDQINTDSDNPIA